MFALLKLPSNIITHVPVSFSFHCLRLGGRKRPFQTAKIVWTMTVYSPMPLVCIKPSDAVHLYKNTAALRWGGLLYLVYGGWKLPALWHQYIPPDKYWFSFHRFLHDIIHLNWGWQAFFLILELSMLERCVLNYAQPPFVFSVGLSRPAPLWDKSLCEPAPRAVGEGPSQTYILASPVSAKAKGRDILLMIVSMICTYQMKYLVACRLSCKNSGRWRDLQKPKILMACGAHGHPA